MVNININPVIDYLFYSLQDVVPEEEWDYIEEIIEEVEEKLNQHLRDVLEEKEKKLGGKKDV